MAFPSTPFDSVVTNMMSRFGGPATVLVAGASVYDPATSSSVVVDIPYQVHAIFMDLTLQRNGARDLSNSLVQEGDKEVYVQPANKADPNLTFPTELFPNKDRIQVGTKVYKIVSFKQINTTMSNAVLLQLYVRE